MNKKWITCCLLAILLLPALLCACGENAPQEAQPRTTLTQVPEVQAPGTEVCEGEGYCLDHSNTARGYVMLRYSGQAAKGRLQIAAPNGNSYIYPLADAGSFSAFPLQAGSGSYTIHILEHAYDDFYALLGSETVDVTVEDEFSPFLYPNCYVWFTQQSKAAELARRLSDEGETDIGFLTSVYHYVTGSIIYDDEKAQHVPTDYVPDIDETLATGKGICFDYASLMAAMLRSQGIPTRLVVGYAGTVPHAWISVWLANTGWLDRIIEFDGTEWKMLDPTLAASNDPRTVKRYLSENNYTVKYYY